MVRLLNTFVDICLLRVGPQQLPASISLLVATLAAYVMVGIVLARPLLPGLDPRLFAAIDTLLLLGFIWFALSFKGYYRRFIQTATAFAGTNVLLNAIAWLLLSWQARLAAQGVANELPALLLLAHLVWHVAVISNIVRHALSVSLAWGWGISLLYLFVYTLLIRLIMVALS